jgi:Spy/CpxP family protein refolding chaperone
MKKLMLLCCLIIGLTAASRAQSNKPSVTDPTEKAKQLKKQLNLSDSQTSKVAVIYEDSAQQFEKIKVNNHGDNDKMLAEIKPLRKNTITKIKAVLTPQQSAQYDKLLSKSSASNSGWSDGWSSTASGQ